MTRGEIIQKPSAFPSTLRDFYGPGRVMYNSLYQHISPQSKSPDLQTYASYALRPLAPNAITRKPTVPDAFLIGAIDRLQYKMIGVE